MDTIEDLTNKIEDLQRKLADQKKAIRKAMDVEGGFDRSKALLRSANNTENELRESMRRLKLLTGKI